MPVILHSGLRCTAALSRDARGSSRTSGNADDHTTKSPNPPANTRELPREVESLSPLGSLAFGRTRREADQGSLPTYRHGGVLHVLRYLVNLCRCCEPSKRQGCIRGTNTGRSE